MDVESGNFHANEQTTEPAMPPANRQDSSLFFQRLPTEIRLEIYSQLFSSTRLSFGERLGHLGQDKSPVLASLRPAPNSLSLLRVCRRIIDEIGDSWLGQVLFSFKDPEIMLDKLTSMDSQVLSKLRHMRYSEERLHGLLRARNGNPLGHGHHLVHMLKLLPGLCLDRLTVFGDVRKESRYRELDDLIRHSNGWKELCFLSHNSEMLGYPKFKKGSYGNVPDEFLRAPQPSAWRQALSHRDGPTASVSIYRASHAAGHGSRVPTPATCQPFIDQVADPCKKYGVEEDAALMAPGEKQKELLVVVRRGKGVDYVEKPGSPLLTCDIRKNWPDMTWGQMRALDVGWDNETRSIVRPNGLGSQNDEAAGPKVYGFERLIRVDTYDNFDEYSWSLFHMTENLW